MCVCVCIVIDRIIERFKNVKITEKMERKLNSEQFSMITYGKNWKWERDALRINFHGIVNGTLYL